MSSSGMLRRVALVRTDVSEELSSSFIRPTRIGELGTTLIKEALSPAKHRFLQEQHGVHNEGKEETGDRRHGEEGNN
jgi:hypothetical protein